MASFYCSSVQEFLAQSDAEVLARLSVAYATRGYTSQYSDQTLTWARDLASMRSSLQQCTARSAEAGAWGLLLEFSIPRKELRVDVVLLVRDIIVALEAKTAHATPQARRQIEEYALLLYYFHKASDNRRIVPVLLSSDLAPNLPATDLAVIQQRELFPQLPTYWVTPVLKSTWETLVEVLLAVEKDAGEQLSAETWNSSPYFPVPSILEAAIALRSGLAIREIAHSEASEHEIGAVRETIQCYVEEARLERRHTICFLTGVPGSGKTLVGLSLAHATENKNNSIHFMSGNGPLVQVLQHLFTQESMRGGAMASQARAEAKTLIENVHVFARYHTEGQPGSSIQPRHYF